MRRLLFALILSLIQALPVRAQILSGFAPYEPESQDYFNRISVAGSGISLTHKLAVDQLVKELKASSSWTRYSAIYPFCGTNLAAAKIPLKYPSFGTTATPYSLGVVGMVESNYVSGVGVYGTASRYFTTGINFTNYSTNAGGLSAFVNNDAAPSALQFLLGSDATANTPDLRLNATIADSGWGGSSIRPQMSQGAFHAGVYHGWRQDGSTMRLLVNGKQTISPATTAISTTNKSVILNIMGTTAGFATTNIVSFAAIDDGAWISTNQVELADLAVLRFVRAAGRRSPNPWPMCFIPSYGQSLSIGTASGTPASTTYSQLGTRTATRGPVGVSSQFTLTGFTPSIEPFTETHCRGFADAFATRAQADGNGHTNDPVVMSFGVASSAYSVLQRGTAPYTNFTNYVAISKQFSVDYNTSFFVPAIVMVHGESDYISATYQTDIETWQANLEADIQGITGQTNAIPMFHTQIDSWYPESGNTATTATSPYATLAAYKANPRKSVLVGPKYVQAYNSDGIHMPSASYRWLGEYYAKALYTNLVLGGTFTPLYPTNVVRTNADIYLTFPTGVDLQLDTTLVSTNSNWGFEFADDSGSTPTITAVAFFGSTPTNTVKITLSGTPTGANKFVRAAYTATGTGKAGPTTGPRTNLKRPDAVWTSLYGNDMSDWCCHFKEVCP